MRYLVLYVLIFCTLLLAGCGQTPPQDVTSAGCRNLNDAFYDDAYLSGNVYFSPFKKGESVSVALASPDAATKIYLIVTDTSGGTRRDLATWSAASGEPLLYVFGQDLTEAEVYWSADAGVPEWAVGCG